LLSEVLFKKSKEELRFNFLRFVQLLTDRRSSAVTGLSDRSKSVTLGWSNMNNCGPERPLFRKTCLSGSFKFGGRVMSSERGNEEDGFVRLSKDKERREGME